MTKTILICGGLGEISRTFIKKYPDFEYVLLDQKDISEVPDEIKNDNRYFQVDITNYKSLEKISADFDFKLDGIIVTPNFNPKTLFEDTSFDDLQKAIQVKSLGHTFLIKVLLKFMKTDCSTVFIGSIHGQKASAGDLAYAMSNAAIEALARGLAVEYKRKFRFNTVSPGGTLTEDYKKDHTDSWKEKLEKGQLVDLNDLINVIYFLISNESKAINGQNIIVDGGVSAQRVTSSAW